MNAYLWLILAIIAEVIATSALKATVGFTRLLPSIITGLGYAFAFYALSQSIKTVPLGIAYAIWSGLGTALVVIIAWIIYQQPLNIRTICGITFIIIGVIILQLSSPH
ncbi:DMT family transporter [Suttonella ornithocola]|uniref:Methyl viologen resistance protein C n=1 Tax=Suttonella ornithocola TaxID=279832 RepID=A0A380MYZ3_9GAMM|nr:multidrug efflux SMR transporter [Suttonella ornithocola]SUO97123.1 Methyl viologen resistance protein C [Suttonella ornithocola]